MRSAALVLAALAFAAGVTFLAERIASPQVGVDPVQVDEPLAPPVAPARTTQPTTTQPSRTEPEPPPQTTTPSPGPSTEPDDGDRSGPGDGDDGSGRGRGRGRGRGGDDD